MLVCSKCGDQVPDPAQAGQGTNDLGSRCRHIDCRGIYRDA